MQKVAGDWRKSGVRVVLVPTMGSLHAGHGSLVERARKLAGPRGKVVVSIYVNPTQFGPKEDYTRYPRSLGADARLCRAAGADTIFAPHNREIYPSSPEAEYSTYVVEEKLSQSMEGASRPTHFRGVTTIVAKLFHLAQPDIAIFGAKDWQQAAVIQKMVTDLDFPLKVVVAPTVRERDGLAMSSRNQYLIGDLRTQATVLHRAIKLAQSEVRAAKSPVSAAALRTKMQRVISSAPAARVDYIAFFHPRTLQPVTRVARGVQVALAVFVGKTRLIDNAPL